WDESAAVDVGAGVAGRGHYQDSMLVGVVDRVGERPRIGGEATQGEVDHIRTDVGGVGDGPGDVEQRAARGACSNREDRGGGSHPGDTHAVQGGGRHPGDLGPVSLRGVRRVVVTVDQVPAVDIVDESVPVVVHAVAGYLTAVREDPIGQIGMVEIHPAVDDCDHHTGPGGFVPDVGSTHHL